MISDFTYVPSTSGTKRDSNLCVGGGSKWYEKRRANVWLVTLRGALFNCSIQINKNKETSRWHQLLCFLLSFFESFPYPFAAVFDAVVMVEFYYFFNHLRNYWIFTYALLAAVKGIWTHFPTVANKIMLFCCFWYNFFWQLGRNRLRSAFQSTSFHLRVFACRLVLLQLWFSSYNILSSTADACLVVSAPSK